MTTGVIASPPILQFTLNDGSLAVNGSILTQVGGVNAATYSDSGLTVPLPNPIPLNSRGEVSDAAGNSKQLFLTPNTVYTFTLYDGPSGTGNQIWQATYVNGVQVSLTQSTVGAALYPQTTQEQNAGVTPVNSYYPPGHLYRYGTNTVPGSTDMTSACNSWLSVGGDLFMPIPDTVLVSGVLNMVSNTKLTLVEGALFKTNTAGLSVFKALSKSNIIISGGTIQQTANNATAHIGLIELNSCTHCTVKDVEFIGAQWAGILLSGSSNCFIRGNYIHNSLGVSVENEDSHDISCYGASSFNVIDGNICYGGTTVEHGIMIQDPGSSLIPLKNVVTNNRVGPHKSYGILNYLIDHANTWCQIIGNEVEGVTGTGQTGGSGMGIYNQGAGGTIIANNIVRNCCINTSSFSLIPAGITLNLDSTKMPVNCIGNHVSDIVNGSACISVSNGPANIEGNVIVQSAGMTTAIGIDINTASNVQVVGNQITIDTSIASSQGILSLAGANISNINITGNYVLGCSGEHIRVDTSASFTSTNVVVSGNVTSSASANCVPLQLNQIRNGSVTGNQLTATGNIVVSITASQGVTYTGNACSGGTAAPQVVFAGTCSSSYWDKSNILGTFINNQATGQICEILRNATPGTGFNSQVGDRVEQQVPVVGNPKGWRCTVAGNPGTWVSEGNL